MWLAVLLACSPDRGPHGPRLPTSEPTPEPDPPATGCLDVVGTSPAADATGVFPWAPIEITLTEPDGGATLVVSDATGAGIAGTREWDGAVLRFTPDVPLDREATYEAVATGSCGELRWAFTTAGDGPIDPAELSGGAWLLDLGAGYWFEPENGYFDSVFRDTAWLVEVTSADATSITFLQALAVLETGEQDRCWPTPTLAPGTFTANPAFAVGPLDLVTATGRLHLDARFQDLEISGTFGDTPLDLRIEGYVEAWPGLCEDVDCVPCPGGVGSCVELVVRDIPATFQPDTALVSRTPMQVANDDACR